MIGLFKVIPLWGWFFVLLYLFNLFTAVILAFVTIDLLLFIKLVINILVVVFCLWVYLKDPDSARRKVSKLFLCGKKGRFRALISLSRIMMCILLLVLHLIYLGMHYLLPIVVLGIFSFTFILIVLFFYESLKRYIKPEFKFFFDKTAIFLYMLSFFISQMFASDYLRGVGDVEGSEVYFTYYALTIFILIFSFSVISFFIMFVFFNCLWIKKEKLRIVIEKVNKNYNAMMRVFLLVLVSLAIPYYLELMEALFSYFYSFDTKDSFHCGERYQVIPELESKAGYLYIGSGEFRAFYKKEGHLQAITIKCHADGKFTWFPIETAAQVDQRNRG